MNFLKIILVVVGSFFIIALLGVAYLFNAKIKNAEKREKKEFPREVESE